MDKYKIALYGGQTDGWTIIIFIIDSRQVRAVQGAGVLVWSGLECRAKKYVVHETRLQIEVNFIVIR